MHDAEKQGTDEERERIALEQTETLIRLTKDGVVPHYVLVLDRSPAAQDFLVRMKTGPAELKVRTSTEAVRTWEALSQYRYLVISGTWGRVGGLVVPAADLEALVDEVLPEVLTTLEERGGLCGFFVAVADSERDEVLAKLAELQPVEGDLPN